jgi:glutathione synthase/RimK-type ligase-like ATP-grasp enzyme
VLLATCRELPDGEPGHEALDDALARRGIDAAWAAWDDPDVAWSDADLVAVRSTWDYMGRLDEFLTWAQRLDPVLLHGSAMFRWNTDKRYLLEMAAAGLPVVPTTPAPTEADVRALVHEGGRWVVKPTVGANGLGVTVVEDGVWVPAGTGPWLVQPLVDSIATEGETSVFVIDGRVVGQVLKTPAVGEFRVHEELGGRARTTALTDEAGDISSRAYAATERILGLELAYARIDLLRHEGRLVVTEVEITEPGLYLDVAPEIAEPFAEAVARRL